MVSDLAAADLETLVAESFLLIERRTITTLAVTLDRLAAPEGLTLLAARDRVRDLPSGSDADLNHFYRTSQRTAPATAAAARPCTHENCAAWQMIGWPGDRIAAEACPVTAPVGLIDTGINARHEIFRGARLRGARLTLLARASADAPSDAVRGTAVASLLIGSRGSRVPGLLPAAEVLAVDVFAASGGDTRADIPALVEGLDLLVTRNHIYDH